MRTSPVAKRKVKRIFWIDRRFDGDDKEIKIGVEVAIKHIGTKGNVGDYGNRISKYSYTMTRIFCRGTAGAICKGMMYLFPDNENAETIEIEEPFDISGTINCTLRDPTNLSEFEKEVVDNIRRMMARDRATTLSGQPPNPLDSSSGEAAIKRFLEKVKVALGEQYNKAAEQYDNDDIRGEVGRGLSYSKAKNTFNGLFREDGSDVKWEAGRHDPELAEDGGLLLMGSGIGEFGLDYSDKRIVVTGHDFSRLVSFGIHPFPFAVVVSGVGTILDGMMVPRKMKTTLITHDGERFHLLPMDDVGLDTSMEALDMAVMLKVGKAGILKKEEAPKAVEPPPVPVPVRAEEPNVAVSKAVVAEPAKRSKGDGKLTLSQALRNIVVPFKIPTVSATV